ncbi:GAF domain-containing protein [uncultured Deinococcus sp.]|uniref:GAF domain-containing protein n=1 Tax=uncultured Deinococcus sp. TaxID=158789 RepID=UPI002585F8E9|nr:GAF domain-containing protein [uncultured Deinococcus sp.]
MTARVSSTTELAEQLQHLTGQLAATHTQSEVLSAALAPAIGALNALSGALLLLDGQGQTLSIAAVQGDQGKTVWQDGPLTPATPAGDAVLSRRPLYFEHAGTLTQAYPELEEHTGGLAAVATAILPLLLGEEVLGVLILDFREPHTFTDDERRFLSTLAAQTSVALDRSRLIRRLGEEAARIRASTARFQHLVETSPTGMAVGSLDGQLTLVNDAYLHLLGYTRAEYDAGQIDWQALTPEEYREQDGRAFAAAFEQGVSTTYDKEMLTRSGTRLPVRLTLIRYDGRQVVGHIQDLRLYWAQQRQIEAEQWTVAQQSLALEAEQAAMQTSVQFVEAASRIDDLGALVQLALDTLQTLIPGANVAFTQRTPDRWQLLHASDNLAPDLSQLARTQGFSPDTPVFAELVRTGQPSFVDDWDARREGVAHSEHFTSVAHYPVEQGGEVVAALGIAVTSQRSWSPTQRAVIRAVGRSFTLLYERIAVARTLQAQNAELMARTQVMELLASVTSDLATHQGNYALVQQLQERVLTLLPPGHAAYWEPVGELWHMRAHVNDIGRPDLMAILRAGLPRGQTPTLDRPWASGEALYQDDYADGMDVAADLTGHVFAVASLPVGVGSARRGVINFTTFQPHRWSATEQSLLSTLAHGLSVALDREEAVRTLADKARILAQANQELEASNAELEAFTYSASHDLRTPVRHVQGFADLALRALDRGQPEKVRRNLDIVSGATERMTAMIDAMLVLSRVGRQPLQVLPCDLAQVVAQAQQDVQLAFQEQEVEWDLGELPVVQADRTLLQQVMAHLLGNAVKFSLGQTPAHVRVWAEQRPAEVAVFVQDRGAGFNMAYADKLFGAFQRLHTQQEFAGTGIGLATVRRIVARHGGRVWARGEVGQGATFAFTLPAHPLAVPPSPE